MGIKERKRRDLEARRRLILTAAKDLFVRRGFARVTLDDIAGAVEFSKGTIYNHFGSKEEIFASLLLEHLDSLLAYLRDAVRTGRTTAERLRNALRAYLRLYREHRDHFRLLFFIDVVSDQERIPEPLRREIRLRKIACLVELQAIIKEGVRTGEVEGGRPAAQVGMVLWGMLNGVIQLAESQQVKEEILDRLLGVGFDITLAGLKHPA